MQIPPPETATPSPAKPRETGASTLVESIFPSLVLPGLTGWLAYRMGGLTAWLPMLALLIGVIAPATAFGTLRGRAPHAADAWRTSQDALAAGLLVALASSLLGVGVFGPVLLWALVALLFQRPTRSAVLLGLPALGVMVLLPWARGLPLSLPLEIWASSFGFQPSLLGRPAELAPWREILLVLLLWIPPLGQAPVEGRQSVGPTRALASLAILVLGQIAGGFVVFQALRAAGGDATDPLTSLFVIVPDALGPFAWSWRLALLATLLAAALQRLAGVRRALDALDPPWIPRGILLAVALAASFFFSENNLLLPLSLSLGFGPLVALTWAFWAWRPDVATTLREVRRERDLPRLLFTLPALDLWLLSAVALLVTVGVLWLRDPAWNVIPAAVWVAVTGLCATILHRWPRRLP